MKKLLTLHSKMSRIMLVLFLLSIGAMQSNAQCPPTNTVVGGNFSPRVNDSSPLTGWTVAPTGGASSGWYNSYGGSAGDGKAEITVNGVATATLSQTLNNLDKVEGGVAKLTFKLGAQDYNGVAGHTAVLTISLGSTLYATITNGTTRSNDNVTISYANGATGTFATFGTAGAISFTERTFTINMPYTGAPTAALVFNANTSGNDDWTIDNVYLPVYICANISGFVYNDVNGNTDNIVNGVLYTATGLNAYLIDANNKVVAISPVTGGAYSFVNQPSVNCSVLISTNSATVGGNAPAVVLPLGFVSTGEKNCVTTLGCNGNDGTANGILNLGTVTSNITQANFGIEQPPTAGSGSNYVGVNPGGTAQVTVLPNTFTNISVSSDPSPGGLTGIVITAFPTGATSIVIGGVSYTTLTAIQSAYPNGIPTDPSGNPTPTITVDPTATGATSVSIPFKGRDAAGKLSSNTGTAIINFANSLCAVTNTVVGGVFDAPVPRDGVLQGWTVSPIGGENSGWYNSYDGAPGEGKAEITKDGVPSAKLSQTLTNLDKAVLDNGKIPLSLKLGAQDYNNAAGTTATLKISLGGILYATITNGTARNANNVTIVYANGASGTFPASFGTEGPNGYRTTIFSLLMPYVSATAALVFDANTPVNGDDWTIDDVYVPVSLCADISGNVFNDVNGNTDNLVNGDPYTATGLNAVLVDNSSGKVVAISPVNASGKFNFASVNYGNYSVRITTNTATVGATPPAVSLPAGFVSTGEKNCVNTAGCTGSEVTVDGIIVLGTVNSTITQVNFGIEQPPTVGNGVTNNVTNPGGTVQVTVPENTFTNGANSSDPAPGDVTGIRITAFPSGATSIVINGITYQASVPANVTALTALIIPTDANGNPTVVITVDPTTNGVTTVDIPFVALDAAGKVSSNTANGAGHAIINFVDLSVSGTVFNDGDGFTNYLIDGTATNTIGTNTLFANLLNSSGNVVASIPVAINGTYSFGTANGLEGNATYTIAITNGIQTIGNVPVTTLINAVNTSEAVTSSPGNPNQDGLNDGRTEVIVGTSNVSGVNFGIDRLPESYNVTKTVSGPPVVGAPALSLLSDPMQGSDPEDAGKQTQVSWSGSDLKISTLPTNEFLLKYNGIAVTIGQEIIGYDPSLLTIEATSSTPLGTNTTSFTYAIKDNAGYYDQTPATYTINFGVPLPITLLSFNAKIDDNATILQWITAFEKNNQGFEIERSANGNQWNKIGFVNSLSENGNSSQKLSYQFYDYQPLIGMNFYRLKQTDFDGKFEYSIIRQVQFDNKAMISIYPNPTKQMVTITGLSGAGTVGIYDLVGRKLMERKIETSEITISLDTFQGGMYYIRIIDENGKEHSEKLIKIN